VPYSGAETNRAAVVETATDASTREENTSYGVVARGKSTADRRIRERVAKKDDVLSRAQVNVVK